MAVGQCRVQFMPNAGLQKGIATLLMCVADAPGETALPQTQDDAAATEELLPNTVHCS